MHEHFENWNDMKHEPQNFWSAETIFYFNVKLFPYTISDGESQTPLLWFFLRGGGSVHRLDNDKSRYFVITELNNNCFIIWSTCISSESKAICHFIFYFIIFILLFCHTQWITSRIKTIINRLTNIKFKICALLGRSDCGGEISEKPSLWGIEISPHGQFKY